MEWAHLSPEKRREYFFSTAEIGVLVLCVGIPPLFAWFIAIHPAVAAIKAAAYGLSFGLVFVALLWTLKSVYVLASLRRCPHEDQTELHGSLPWQW